MRLEQSFEVAAPIDQVWAAPNDLERLAPCLPGAAITAPEGEMDAEAAAASAGARPVGGIGLFF